MRFIILSIAFHAILILTFSNIKKENLTVEYSLDNLDNLDKSIFREINYELNGEYSLDNILISVKN